MTCISTHASKDHVSLARIRSIGRCERISHCVNIVTIEFQISNRIWIGRIANQCDPNPSTVIPVIADDCNVWVVWTWDWARLVNSLPMILVLVYLYSYVYLLVFLIYPYPSGDLHDIRVFWLDEVLGEVVLSVELGKIVAADLIRVVVLAQDSYHIGIDSSVASWVRAVYIDTSLKDQRALLVEDFIVTLSCCLKSSIVF